MKSKILFIVEGEFTEPRLLGNSGRGLLSLIGVDDYDIVSFGSCIYELYDAYMKGKYDNIVSYLRTEKGLKIDDNVLSKNAFSAIYLIFDYEPHYQKYSDDKIGEMLSIFNDETDMGKLYINYPMVEAYLDLRCLPDDSYIKRVVSLSNFNGKNYKYSVNVNSCLKKNKIKKRELSYIVLHNYNKAKMITSDSCNSIDYDKILQVQIDMKNKLNSIYVLSTFALLPIDYNYEMTVNVLKKELGDDNIIE